MTTPTKPVTLAVLISGNGSNLQAIIDAIANGNLPAEISIVISNRTHAAGLERARRAGIPTAVLTSQQFPNRQEYEQALQTYLDGYHPELIILAGFMRVLGEDFVQHFRNQILNIHPSLLPKYPGLNTHQQVITAQDRSHGTTVHVVTAQLDAGPIVAQASTTVIPEDDVNSLAEKIHGLEHRIYPEIIRLYAEKRLKFLGNSVFLDGIKLPRQGLQLAFAEISS